MSYIRLKILINEINDLQFHFLDVKPALPIWKNPTVWPLTTCHNTK